MDENIEKPLIHYPCPWTYAVIGPVEKDVRAAIAEVVEARPHRISFSKQSQGGKFTALHLELTVKNEQDRNRIFVALQSNPSVKTVI